MVHCIEKCGVPQTGGIAMRTPKEYTNNIKNHIITKQMLLDCLYSSNKRAKNWRDKEREYRHSYDYYGNEEKAREQKNAYYEQKDIMLSILHPVCIHKELLGYERERIYDYEDEYEKYFGQYVWENCYYDREEQRTVYFGDIELKDHPRYNYYLFYDIGGNHTFHTPIDSDEIELYGLEVVEIDHLETHGYDVSDLISNQFVKKVINLIQTENYEYVA